MRGKLRQPVWLVDSWERFPNYRVCAQRTGCILSSEGLACQTDGQQKAAEGYRVKHNAGPGSASR